MISNTIEMLFIGYSNSLLQKMCFFFLILDILHSFTLASCSSSGPRRTYLALFTGMPLLCLSRVLFSCLINVFLAYIYGKFCCFFKWLINFKAHALQSELNKVWCTTFVKFLLQSMSSKFEHTFEKTTKNVFVFILPTPTLTSYFGTFS